MSAASLQDIFEVIAKEVLQAHILYTERYLGDPMEGYFFKEAFPRTYLISALCDLPEIAPDIVDVIADCIRVDNMADIVYGKGYWEIKNGKYQANNVNSESHYKIFPEDPFEGGFESSLYYGASKGYPYEKREWAGISLTVDKIMNWILPYLYQSIGGHLGIVDALLSARACELNVGSELLYIGLQGNFSEEDIIHLLKIWGAKKDRSHQYYLRFLFGIASYRHYGNLMTYLDNMESNAAKPEAAEFAYRLRGSWLTSGSSINLQHSPESECPLGKNAKILWHLERADAVTWRGRTIDKRNVLSRASEALQELKWLAVQDIEARRILTEIALKKGEVYSRQLTSLLVLLSVGTQADDVPIQQIIECLYGDEQNRSIYWTYWDVILPLIVSGGLDTDILSSEEVRDRLQKELKNGFVGAFLLVSLMVSEAVERYPDVKQSLDTLLSWASDWNDERVTEDERRKQIAIQIKKIRLNLTKPPWDEHYRYQIDDLESGRIAVEELCQDWAWLRFPVLINWLSRPYLPTAKRLRIQAALTFLGCGPEFFLNDSRLWIGLKEGIWESGITYCGREIFSESYVWYNLERLNYQGIRIFLSHDLHGLESDEKYSRSVLAVTTVERLWKLDSPFKGYT